MSLERRLGLKDDENLLSVVRRAPITLFFPAVLVAALLVAPFFFLVPLLRLETLGAIVIGLSLFVGLLVGGRGLFMWQRTLLAVTERRLVFVRQNGFFDRHVTELPYARVQEVAYRVRGLVPTVFKYGALLIESAGGQEPIVMERVSHPERVQELITELQNGGHGGFGDMLQAVSRLDARQLGLLKSEVERTLRLLPPEEGA